MLEIRIIAVGLLSKPYFKAAIEEYAKRLKAFCKLNIIELNDARPTSNAPNASEITKLLNEEAERIAKHLKGYTVVLDVDGKMQTSEGLANKLETLATAGNSCISLVIGGSWGVSGEIKQQANELWSFSRLTFPHQLFRVMLLEQVYRAFTILGNLPYHK